MIQSFGAKRGPKYRKSHNISKGSNSMGPRAMSVGLGGWDWEALHWPCIALNHYSLLIITPPRRAEPPIRLILDRHHLRCQKCTFSYWKTNILRPQATSRPSSVSKKYTFFQWKINIFTSNALALFCLPQVVLSTMHILRNILRPQATSRPSSVSKKYIIS